MAGGGRRARHIVVIGLECTGEGINAVFCRCQSIQNQEQIPQLKGWNKKQARHTIRQLSSEACFEVKESRDRTLCHSNSDRCLSSLCRRLCDRNSDRYLSCG